MGEDYIHNPIKKKSKGTAKKILRLILEKEGDMFYNEEKGVFRTAKEFLTYIDSGNIFAAKAKEEGYVQGKKRKSITDTRRSKKAYITA